MFVADRPDASRFLICLVTVKPPAEDDVNSVWNSNYTDLFLSPLELSGP
jgi:hypothetical protein